MKILFVILAVSIAPLLRETNSHAAATRGEKAYAGSKYAEAVAAYSEAQTLKPSARGAFNLGTSRRTGALRR